MDAAAGSEGHEAGAVFIVVGWGSGGRRRVGCGMWDVAWWDWVRWFVDGCFAVGIELYEELDGTERDIERTQFRLGICPLSHHGPKLSAAKAQRVAVRYGTVA